ncbi:GNAT family N-acetyltransferase [Pelotomaculum propionicicum]|uniref:dTDP-fucosamine acetyltransferase n=1 Tax=Pelotomaculum propionicicum TaxID=258475 RepID=A0A4Y7RLS5_9FIRM|nr:GNAT family N-acetyltransferase [Pelotomaculum propionicicum]NLI12649.1 GNAT family N-acetyltransferase [Peptococcaceae bacterium]TEB09776.1 dTDP-fucosamine acetyltransferase [Pelotomaculum propionicicum]
MTGVVPQYLIRRANLNDISSLIRLLGILFSIETDFAVDESKQRRGLEIMLGNPDNRCVMAAEINQKIVGMCTAQLLVSTAEGGLAALIEDLVVEDGYRRYGIGKNLLFSVESWAVQKGARRLELLADRDNTRALEFYKKMNWKYTRLICLHKK